MNTQRSTLVRAAESRLTAAPNIPQRYGLSVFLRKTYPSVKVHTRDGVQNGAVRVRGADVERTHWDDQPPEVITLLQRRANDDAFVASQVLQSAYVDRVRIDGVHTLEVSLRPGAILLVDVAPKSRLVVTEDEPSNKDNGSMQGVLVVLRVGEGAHVQWFGQSVRAPGYTVIERLALLGQDAVLEQHSAVLAANAVRENIHVVLDAPGATARVSTFFAGDRDHQFDLGVTAEHCAPHTISNLAAKGVLAGTAQAVYRGLVRVAREAHGSDGYQRCDTLLLSPTAEVDPVPNLEINTDDVRCTHGVTVSSVNPEHLFYLQSRGVSPATARQLLVEGFGGRMLQLYPAEQRDMLHTELRALLTGTV